MGGAPIISAIFRARGQGRRLAEQQEGNHLPDQRERKKSGPQSRSRSRPDLAGKSARHQHRRCRDTDAREDEIEGIEGARGDLDQEEGGAPKER